MVDTLDVAELTFIAFDGGDSLQIQATMGISPNHGVDVSTNAVEDGADISDHARPQPETLSLTIFVSELEGQEGEYDKFFMGDHITIRERFLQSLKDGELLHIDLGPDKGIYSDMLITNMSPSWEPGGGKSLNFTLALQQIKRVTAKTEPSPKAKAKLAAAALGSGGRAKFTPGTSRIRGASTELLHNQSGVFNSDGVKPPTAIGGLEQAASAAFNNSGLAANAWVRF